MAKVEISTGGTGGGGPVTTTVKVFSREFSVVDGEETAFDPAVTQRIEYDHEGKMSSITTNCGETENRRASDENPQITAEGIMVEDDIQDIKQLKRGDELTVISDVHQGRVEVRRVTFEQNTDILSFKPDSGERQLAFSFQLQLRIAGGL